MLSKLIKYDIRSTWRDFAGVYMSILLGVVIVPLILNNISNQIINILTGFIATGIVTATIVVMVINLFKIFNTNVFSREGYLTMTLPVNSSQIVVSKLIVSTMWIVLTGMVSMIGLFLFLLVIDPSNIGGIFDKIQQILSLLNGRGISPIILFIIAMIISTVKEISKLFLACSIAHLRQLKRFRIPAGILSYFVFSWMETLIVQVIGLIMSFIPYSDKLIQQLNAMSSLESIQQFTGLFNGVMSLGILYSLLLTAAFSIGTVWILNHKLDLD